MVLCRFKAASRFTSLTAVVLRVLVVFQRTGEFQESPQDFSAAGPGQACAPPKPPEDEKCVHYISSIGRVAGRLAEVV